MSAKDDGGPAFPTEWWETEHGDRVIATSGHGGMSLRDYFAGQALVGLLASTAHPNATGPQNFGTTERLGEKAYECADGMLAARAALSAARGEGG